MKRAHHMTDVWRASQNVQPVVGRCDQLHMVDQRACSASRELKQVRLVAVQHRVPSKVGAAMADRHVPQDTGRNFRRHIAPIHMSVLAADIHNAFRTILPRADASRQKRQVNALQIQCVDGSSPTHHNAAPTPLHVQSHTPVKRVPQERALNGTFWGAFGGQETTPCHNKRTGIHIVRSRQHIPHIFVARRGREFGTSTALHAQDGRAGFDGERVHGVDKHLLSQNIGVVTGPCRRSNTGAPVVADPDGVSLRHVWTSTGTSGVKHALRLCPDWTQGQHRNEANGQVPLHQVRFVHVLRGQAVAKEGERPFPLKVRQSGDPESYSGNTSNHSRFFRNSGVAQNA